MSITGNSVGTYPQKKVETVGDCRYNDKNLPMKKRKSLLNVKMVKRVRFLHNVRRFSLREIGRQLGKDPKQIWLWFHADY